MAVLTFASAMLYSLALINSRSLIIKRILVVAPFGLVISMAASAGYLSKKSVGQGTAISNYPIMYENRLIIYDRGEISDFYSGDTSYCLSSL